MVLVTCFQQVLIEKLIKKRDVHRLVVNSNFKMNSFSEFKNDETDLPVFIFCSHNNM